MKQRIPQMFYLRKMMITVHVKDGPSVMRKNIIVHVYWNYRNTIHGIVDTDDREFAKHAIIYGDISVKGKKIYSGNPPQDDAEFYR
jgi:hypothetical protein